MLKLAASALLVGAVLGAGCNAPPQLPAVDTMELRLPSRGASIDTASPKAEGAEGPTTGANLETALAAMAPTLDRLEAKLAPTRLILAGATGVQPETTGDAWRWLTMPATGWWSELHAWRDGATQVRLEARRIGESMTASSSLLVRGHHRSENGDWEIADRSGLQRVEVSWRRMGENGTQIVYSELPAPGPGQKVFYRRQRDLVSIRIEGTASLLGERAMSLHWSTRSGAGRFADDQQVLCWDTFANGQKDIPCPANSTDGVPASAPVAVDRVSGHRDLL